MKLLLELNEITHKTVRAQCLVYTSNERLLRLLPHYCYNEKVAQDYLRVLSGANVLFIH